MIRLKTLKHNAMYGVKTICFVLFWALWVIPIGIGAGHDQQQQKNHTQIIRLLCSQLYDKVVWKTLLEKVYLSRTTIYWSTLPLQRQLFVFNLAFAATFCLIKPGRAKPSQNQTICIYTYYIHYNWKHFTHLLVHICATQCGAQIKPRSIRFGSLTDNSIRNAHVYA